MFSLMSKSINSTVLPIVIKFTKYYHNSKLKVGYAIFLIKLSFIFKSLHHDISKPKAIASEICMFIGTFKYIKTVNMVFIYHFNLVKFKSFFSLLA
ncbi:hypothetical protein A3Q33_17290 [Colwellia sp. PAMC 21821]|nr:hypothetical protein A3Q33_17290 [Colwellia sp. PAMC 21821]